MFGESKSVCISVCALLCFLRFEAHSRNTFFSAGNAASPSLPKPEDADGSPQACVLLRDISLRILQFAVPAR